MSIDQYSNAEKVLAIMQFGGVSPRLFELLMKSFGTLDAILSAEESELSANLITTLPEFDADGNPQIEVVKGPAPDGSDYQIDGLAGATLTGRGVSNFVRYWIGEEGYGPYLKELGQKERQ